MSPASSSQYTCPSCASPQTERFRCSVVYVCEGCRALIHITDQRVISENALSESATAGLALGTRDLDPQYTLVGAMTLESDQGERWVEQLYLSDHGEERWLSIDDGERYVFEELPSSEVKRSSLPLTVEELLQGSRVTYNGRTYTRDEQGGARITGLRGELNDDYELGERYFYWQGYDENDEDSLSAEWDEEGDIQWSHGVWRSGDSDEDGEASGSNVHPFAHIQMLFKGFSFFIIFQFVLTSFLMFNHDSLQSLHTFDVPFKSAVSDSGLIEFETPAFGLPGDREARVELVLPEELRDVVFNAELTPVDDGGARDPIVLKDWGRVADHSLIKDLRSQGRASQLLRPTESFLVRFGVPADGRYVLKLRGAGELQSPSLPQLTPDQPNTLPEAEGGQGDVSLDSKAPTPTGVALATAQRPSARDPIAVFVDGGGYSNTPVKTFWMIFLTVCFGALMISPMRKRVFASPLKIIGVAVMVALTLHMSLTMLCDYRSGHSPVRERTSAIEYSPHYSHFMTATGLYMSARWLNYRSGRSLRSRSSRTGRSHSGFGGGK